MTTFAPGNISRLDILREARALLGTPYVNHQRVPGREGGIDCIGVPIVVARNVGSVAPDFDINGYSLHPDGTMLHLCDKYLIRIGKQDVLPADIVVVSWGDDRAHHVGIVAPHTAYPGRLAIIHAYPKQKEVTEHRLEYSNFMRFIAAYRFPGVAA